MSAFGGPSALKGVVRPGVGPSNRAIPTPGDSARITFTILNAAQDSFSVLADLNTGRPTVTGGGAKWNVIDRPQRAGLTVFGGYDPLQLSVPILFDSFIDGTSVENDIDLLWKMWGRGVRSANASASKAAPVIEVDGDLLPKMIRVSVDNPSPPNWVITGIDEDSSSAVHNSATHVVRLAATVTLEQFVTTSALASLAPTSASARTKTNVYPVGDTMRNVATKQRTTVAALRTLNGYKSNKTLDPYLRDPSKKFTKAVAVKVPRVSA
jgi:hypothetical protein